MPSIGSYIHHTRFNPRLHAGGDFRASSNIRALGLMFQSTPPRRRRQNADELPLEFTTCFNPRLHAGGDLRNSISFGLNSITFQSTPPRRRRLDVSAPATTMTKFQSTPPRRRRQQQHHHERNLQLVSIHASTQEATTITDHTITADTGFNPRLHAGGDYLGRYLGRYFSVSIHASTQEATTCNMLTCELLTWFQSTPPRRRRQKRSQRTRRIRKSFNPRLHAGGDLA